MTSTSLVTDHSAPMVSQLEGWRVPDVKAARLPWRFDTATALREILTLPESLWRNHFNQGYHDGGWHALALRAAPDAPMDVVPIDVAASAYVDLPVLQRCPSIRNMLDSIALPWKSVRLMRLSPSSEIKEHTDAGVCAGNGEVRLHIPLQTVEEVFFHVDGERVPLRAGECWYVDVSRPHRVRNRGLKARIHLVADASMDVRLLEAICAGDAGEPIQGDLDPWEQFLRFKSLVVADMKLTKRLYDIVERDDFISECLSLGREAGLEFEASDVESALKAGHRTWTAQWIM